ncbi:hypothetical protein G6F56_005303 [Rhizopus delemar]|nr:hypothetical protein G6F56_005303 [Rhizopus delemar]
MSSSDRGRDRSWTAEEDIQLCQSWIVVSEGPITGKDKRLPGMLEKIYGNFAREIDGTTCSPGSLMNRYSAINKEITFFNVQVAHMVNENRSGYIETDNASKLYALYY